MRIRFMLFAGAAVLLPGCASSEFPRRFPDSSAGERSFVKFLFCSRGHLTPWEIRSYLQTHGVRFKLKQDRWKGEDVWDTEGCGMWVSLYTGRRQEAEMIPIDINLFYNEYVRPRVGEPLPLIPADADSSMFVSYDRMTEAVRGFSMVFDRQDNKVRAEWRRVPGDGS